MTGPYDDLHGEDLLAAAREVRDAHHGSRITYSPKVFIPLTMLCRDRCGYCTFAQPPARLQSPYMSTEEVKITLKAPERAATIEPVPAEGEEAEDYLCLVMPLRLLDCCHVEVGAAGIVDYEPRGDDCGGCE